jgi:alanine racemase
MVEVTKALIDVGCNFFYLANLDEAINLRKNYPSKKISIAVFEGFFKENELLYLDNNLIPIINNLNQLKRLHKYNVSNQNNNSINAILNIDTGMNRLGLKKEEIDYVYENQYLLKSTKWEFAMSHLTNSSDAHNTSNQKQLNKIHLFSKMFPYFKISFANTGGIILGKKFCLDQTRPGLGLYGIDSFGNNLTIQGKKLKIPFEMFAPIIQIKDVPRGEKISYGGIDKTTENSKLATIGIGYADGWIRLLKKNSSFLIDDQECKILGNITMDSFVIDITNVKNIVLKEESYIKLIDNTNLKNILNSLDLISYEFLSLIGSRIKRKYNEVQS